MKYVAFMRNVMIGRRGLERSLLIDAFERHGAKTANSFLATGNVVFEADAKTAAAIVARVSKVLLTKINLTEPMFIRSMDTLITLNESNPFGAAPSEDVYERCVTFLQEGALRIETLPFQSVRSDFVAFLGTTTEVFSITRLINGRPGQVGKWIEEQVGKPVTTRNWNTVERIIKNYA